MEKGRKEGKRTSWLYRRRKTRGGKEVPTVSIKGGIVGLAGCAGECHPALSTANLASGKKRRN